MTAQQARPRRRARLLACALLLAASPVLPAQDVPALEAPGVRLVHEAGLDGLARRVADLWDGLRADTERKLGFDYPRTATIHIVRGRAAFERVIQEHGAPAPPAHVAAVAFGRRDVIVLQSHIFARSAEDSLPRILQHELVHCFIGHLEREHPWCRVPRWLDEGVAQWVSDAVLFGPPDLLLRAAGKDELLPFAELERAFPEQEGASALAYAQSASLVRFLSSYGAENEHVKGNVRWLLRFMAQGRTFEDALHAVTGLDVASFERAWLGDLQAKSMLGLRDLPAFLFSGILFTLAVLLFATLRVRRARRMAELEADEDRTPPGDPIPS